MRTARVQVLTYRGAADGARAGTRRVTEREGLLLRLETRDGSIGQGEASPLPGYSPDTLVDVERALRHFDWTSLPEPDDSIGSVIRSLEEVGVLLGGAPESARFAAETAWLDLLGQRLGRPLWSLLTDRADAEEPVPLCTFIGGASDATLVDSATRSAARGAHTVKVKIVGPSLGAQVDALCRVRDAIGDVRLRLDANRSLEPASALAEFESLMSVAPELVEEPVPTSALARLGKPPLPLALDESLQDAATWPALLPHLERLGVVALVLKPMALGGFLPCLRLAAEARVRGLDVTVSHLFDGPVGLAAAAHLAVAVGSRTRASGLDRHAGLLAWPVTELPQLGATSLVGTSHTGLGLPPLAAPA